MKNKTIIICLGAICWGSSVIWADGPQLIAPPAVENRDTERIRHLTNLLNKGDLIKFYSVANKIMNVYEGMNDEALNEMGEEEKVEALEIMYLVVKAPLFGTRYGPDTLKSLTTTLDVDIKLECVDLLAEDLWQRNRVFIDTEEITKLRLLYCAYVFWECNNFYDPSLSEGEYMRQYFKLSDYHSKNALTPIVTPEEEAEIQKYVAEQRKMRRSEFAVANEAGQMRRNAFKSKCSRAFTDLRLKHERNKSVSPEQLQRHEMLFLRVLVREYPGKYSVVKKYLNDAGYADDEIEDLVNRTLGRTPATEFLYKGKKSSKKKKLSN